jgi:hypothetical protein
MINRLIALPLAMLGAMVFASLQMHRDTLHSLVTR